MVGKKAKRDIPYARLLNSDHRIEKERESAEFCDALYRRNFFAAERKEDKIRDVVLQRSVSSENMLGGERTTEKCRADKRGNAEEEA